MAEDRDQLNKKKNHAQEEVPPREVDTDFMKEKIKAHPVNRRKLARRTAMTAALAVLFGVIACLVFLVLEPLISSALYPKEDTPAPVSFPEETDDEMSPEDMIASDEEKQKEQTQEAVNQAVSRIDLDTEKIKDEVRTQLEEEFSGTNGYEQIYSALKEIADSMNPGLVTVTAVTPDYDWVGEAYTSTSGMSGIIVAITDQEVLILTKGSSLQEADTIRCTFSDGKSCDGTVKAQDSITGLAVLAVEKSSLEQDTQTAILAVTLGSSARSALVGEPIIAVGSPSGTIGSVSYGVVTNAALSLDIRDSCLYQITTDIYGSTRASGALVDTDGSVVGWIDASYNRSDTPNLVSAIGITELKPLIEHLSNAQPMATIGVHGTDVPREIMESREMPSGVYISLVDMDSPAMEAGIQSGDIITAIGETAVTSEKGLVDTLADCTPGREVSITLKRQTGDGYDEIKLDVTPDDRLQQEQDRSVRKGKDTGNEIY